MTIAFKGSKGYLTMLVAVFLVALSLSLLTLFDVGQVTHAKTRLQHTADATAYSAAVLQARELNFHAYMNRAMVANQVAIGQMVALSSYLQANQQLWYELQQLGQFAQVIPYLGQVIRVATQIAEVTMGTINMMAQYAASNFVNLSDTAIGLFSSASRIWHHAAIIDMGTELNTIAHKNDPSVQLTLGTAALTGSDLRNWFRFIRRNNIESAERPAGRPYHRKHFDEFRGVVLDSQDDFSRGRSQNFWEVDLGLWKLEFRQRGGTAFGSIPGKRRPYYSWSAVDTISLWSKRRLRRRGWEESLPVAWGRQATYHESSAFSWRRAQRTTNWNGASQENGAAWQQVQTRDLFQQGYFEGPRNHITHIGHFKVSESGLNQGFGRPTPQTNQGDNDGLRNFYDLRNDNADLQSQNPRTVDHATTLHILLSKSGDQMNTSNTLTHLPGADSPLGLQRRNTDTLSGNKLFAVAAAHAVFEKPWRLQPDQTTLELANLYSPYWQPKLVSTERRQTALLAAGLESVNQ
ncbi:MAG: Tad domain-containing protein [Hahellaceae bacterium]|nr:Tad domain-containing protein [Hahellaceae bacterium]